jgi:hypothetical protein
MPRSDRAVRVSERIYRALLVAYPEEFRREYGPHMVQAFGDLCREACRRGETLWFVRLWASTLSDLVTSALAQRSSTHVDKEAAMRDHRLAGIGFVLLVVPLFFVVSQVLKYELGIGFLADPLDAFLADPERARIFDLLSPILFLGALGFALALNAYAVLRLNVDWEDGAIVSTARLEMKLANLAVAAASLLLLITLVGYAFLENFAYRY